MDRLVSYDDESILAELRRVATLLPPGPISREAFNARARISEGVARKRFGSWQAALERAGLGDRFSRPGMGASAAQVIDDLQRVSEVVGRRRLTKLDIDEHGREATEKSIAKHYGYLAKALEAAGLEVAAHGRRWTDTDYFENMLEVWTHRGRAPTKGEMDSPPSRITSSAYARKFGTWVRAKQAFVDRVNAEIAESSGPPVLIAAAAPSPSRAKPRPDDQRAIPVGLRYQVLRRDNFKCVLCGQSPASDPSIVLHVDHVLAFSREGKTRPDNLRSLCRDCNLGKGAGD